MNEEVKSNSQLVAHAGAAKVPWSVVEAVPVPESQGRFHRPVPHQELVLGIREELKSRGIMIAREEFALTADFSKLFALFILEVGGLEGGVNKYSLSIGVRNATDQSMKIKGVAGAQVFVCDNMALSGSEFLFARKNTTNVNVYVLVRNGLNKFLPAAEKFQARMKELSETALGDNGAKVAIYNAFTKHDVAALRLLPVVHKAYFEDGPKGDFPEVAPRTVLGLHNAFTRAFKELRPTPQFQATRRLGEVLGL